MIWGLWMVWTAAAAPSAADLARRHPKRPVVIAHRGASLDAPENTLAAYREAIRQGATAAETDVHLTNDGQVVVLHDRTLKRTTDGKGLVRKWTLADVQALDAGTWFGAQFSAERVPALSELLSVVRDQAVLCVEIKAAPERGGEHIASKIAGLLDASGGRDQAIIFSFYPQQVMASKAAMPDVPALFLVQPIDGPVPYTTGLLTMARSIGADMIGLDYRGTTPEFVAQAQSAGFPVFVYTVDAPADIDAMVKAGVDGIITNAPGRTSEILSEVTRASQ